MDVLLEEDSKAFRIRSIDFEFEAKNKEDFHRELREFRELVYITSIPYLGPYFRVSCRGAKFARKLKRYGDPDGETDRIASMALMHFDSDFHSISKINVKLEPTERTPDYLHHSMQAIKSSRNVKSIDMYISGHSLMFEQGGFLPILTRLLETSNGYKVRFAECLLYIDEKYSEVKSIGVDKIVSAMDSITGLLKNMVTPGTTHVSFRDYAFALSVLGQIKTMLTEVYFRYTPVKKILALLNTYGAKIMRFGSTRTEMQIVDIVCKDKMDYDCVMRVREDEIICTFRESYLLNLT